MADTRITIPLTEYETAHVEDGALLEVVYLAPLIINCADDEGAYRLLTAYKFGIVSAGTTVTLRHERIAGGLVWRARVAISRSGKLADYVPRILAPCGGSAERHYRLTAVHKIGTQSIVGRGISNSRDLLEHQDAGDLLGGASNAAAKAVGATASVLIDALLPLVIPIGAFILLRGKLK